MIERTAVITGASQGLGEALARRFWQAGYHVHLLARNVDKLDALRSELVATTSLVASGRQRCVAHGCDLAEPDAVEAFARRLEEDAGSVDVLVNNAAIHGPIGSFAGSDRVGWERAIRVDLLAPVELCRAVLKMMPARGGSIINLSGGGATGPRENFSAYATAKAGLVRFSETLAAEVRERGIRVNCVAPGAMPTSMLGEVLERGAEAAGGREYALAQKVFAEGGASMQGVADLVLFLASEESAGITGKLVSAVWDQWVDWPAHATELAASDVYTLRRIAGRDRNMTWGDK